MQYSPKFKVVPARHVPTGRMTTVEIPVHDNDVEVLGVDWVGNYIARSDGRVYGLTGCCGASVKGSMGATVCRCCYEEVESRVDILNESDITYDVR